MASIIPFLTNPVIWFALFLAAIILALLAWRLRLQWWPAWLTRFILVGLALLALFSAQWGAAKPRSVPQRQVMIIDQSDSVSAEARQQALQQAVRWQAEASQPGAGASAGANPAEKKNRSIVVFGSEAQPVLTQKEQPGAGASAVAATLPQVDGRASDLAGALKLAGNILGSDPGQVILASDGLAPQPGDISAEVNTLARQGDTLDVVPLAPRPFKNDLALGNLSAPKSLWSGTSADLLVPVIGADANTPVQLNLKINGQDSGLAAAPDLANSIASIPTTGGQPAESFYHFHIPTLPEGMVMLEVTASPQDPAQPDAFPGNNSAYTVLQVFAPPRVLLVTANDGTDPVNRFQQALTQKQIQLDTVPPDKLTTNLDTLQQYRVIFLDNLLATQLSNEQITALQVFVSKLSGGLVFLGGRYSYTLGGYQGTPLEAMLPVKLQPPPRTERPPIVFQLILDKSSSMGVAADANGLRPIDLAREAAMRAIETLQAQDYLGVLTFSDDPNWDVPLRPLGGPGGLKQALDAVSRVDAEGITNMLQAMQETLSQVMALPADAPQSRHILLLSDGQSTDGSPSEFEQLAKSAQANGITVSTIALGPDADVKVMKTIAEAGKGRFYAVADASSLPRILITESKAARSENIQSGNTSLKPVEAGHPLLSGMNLEQLPLLHGYNALQSKADQGAEDILVSSSFGDPVLSAWQYGLGRVAAWTGDLGQEWTAGSQSADWQPEDEGAFWAQVVRYMLVDPAQSPAQASVQVEPTRLLVEASIYTPDGSPVNLAEVRFSYADAAGNTTTYQLPQKSAGSYQAELPRPPDGAYRAILSYVGEDGKTVEVPAPFSVNPPDEWLPRDPASGAANLQAWASAANGRVIPLNGIFAAEKPPATTQVGSIDDSWSRLLLALLVLWLLEIAIRRRWLPWME